MASASIPLQRRRLAVAVSGKVPTSLSCELLTVLLRVNRPKIAVRSTLSVKPATQSMAVFCHDCLLAMSTLFGACSQNFCWTDIFFGQVLCWSIVADKLQRNK